MNYITNNSDETKQIGYRFGLRCGGGEVLCLYGDLGAGKTTFAHGFINYFLPGKRVLSPTFIIVRHYRPPQAFIKNIYHVDLYRLAKTEEILATGLTEFMCKPDSIVILEWAEKMGKFLPDKRIDIHFTMLDNDKRKISILEK